MSNRVPSSVPAWIGQFADTIASTVGLAENQASYFYRKLEGSADKFAWGDDWHRLYEYLAARHGMTPKEVDELTFEDIARILRKDYLATAPGGVISVASSSTADGGTLLVKADPGPARAIDRPPADPPGEEAVEDWMMWPPLSAGELAGRLGLEKSKVQVFLSRYRRGHQDCARTIDSPKRREARHLFLPEVVPLLKAHFGLQ
jgi:hypothetical protein